MLEKVVIIGGPFKAKECIGYIGYDGINTNEIISYTTRYYKYLIVLP